MKHQNRPISKRNRCPTRARRPASRHVHTEHSLEPKARSFLSIVVRILRHSSCTAKSCVWDPRGCQTQLRQKMPGFGKDIEVPDWAAKIGRASGAVVLLNGSGAEQADKPQANQILIPKTSPYFLRFLWRLSFDAKPCVPGRPTKAPAKSLWTHGAQKGTHAHADARPTCVCTTLAQIASIVGLNSESFFPGPPRRQAPSAIIFCNVGFRLKLWSATLAAANSYNQTRTHAGHRKTCTHITLTEIGA